MKAFAYQVATSEEHAASLLGEKAVALAGGTNLLNLMKSYVVQPDTVVSITRLPGSSKIEAIDGGLKLGANVRLVDIAESPDVRKLYRALAEAADNVASPQIRHMGTLGGNLCQRPYCWYFTQEGFDCLKRGGTTCPAKDGDNEFHAVLGTDGPCVATHPSSLAPALVALDAKVRIVGPKGAREIPVEELFVLPKVDPKRETVLAPNEIVTHVILPAPTARPLSATYEVRSKEANDWPLSVASVALKVEGGLCVDSRIALGAVAPVPWRSKEAEEALKGKPLNEASAAAAADLALKGAAPLSRNAYKVKTAHTALRRAILAAASPAAASSPPK